MIGLVILGGTYGDAGNETRQVVWLGAEATSLSRGERGGWELAVRAEGSLALVNKQAMAGGVGAGVMYAVSTEGAVLDVPLATQVRDIQAAGTGEPEHIAEVRAVDAQRDQGVAVGWAGEAAAQDGYAALLCSFAWPCRDALRISGCESSWDYEAVNRSSRGVFQINDIWVPWLAERGFDYWADWATEKNIAMAFAIWSEHGWAPWDCW